MTTTTILTDTAKVTLLRHALEKAEAHLSYCGYGDAWERECAREEKLEELINAALEATKP